MNIAIIGYGKMGKEIEQIAIERNHTIPLIIDHTNQSDISLASKHNIDVAIEFTRPEVVENNIKHCFEQNIPIVTGTTGWNNRQEEIKDLCIRTNQTLVYSSNYSIGVNLFFQLNRIFANIINKHPEYQPSIDEIHHIAKLDKPSGTAITLAEEILEAYPSLKQWSLENEQNTLPISAYREEGAIGTHIIKYASEIDCISLKHEAYSRKGFALGAVIAAEWAYNKKGFYSFQEIINQLIK